MNGNTHVYGCLEVSSILHILADKIAALRDNTNEHIQITSLSTVKEVRDTFDLVKVMSMAKDLLFHFEETYLKDHFPSKNLAVNEENIEEGPPIVRVAKLNFAYHGAGTRVLKDVDLKIMPKQRIYLVGHNGSGKSSLLQCLSGAQVASFKKFELGSLRGNRTTFGALPWCDQFRGLAYLGTVVKQGGRQSSEHDAFSRAVLARDMMQHWQNANLQRREVLCKVLGINLDWKMNQVSDGQRIKVRIMLKLLKPFQLCVVDQFVNDLDILTRQRLFDYLKRECEERKAAVIYATHMFDIPNWATHITFIKEGRLSPVHSLESYEPFQRLVKARVTFPLYRMVVRFLLQSNIHALDYGEINEPEEMLQKDFNPFDSGFESGRAQLSEASTLRTMQEAIRAKRAKK